MIKNEKSIFNLILKTNILISMNISDSHTDFFTYFKKENEKDDYVAQIKSWGVENVVCAIFTYEKNLNIDNIISFNKQIEFLKNKHNINLLLAIEDLEFINNMTDLQKLLSLKPFSIGLTWNFANQFAGGAFSDNGLTPFGKNTIKLIESKNVFIDTAHMSKQSFNDFVEMSKFPIFNSHSNIYALKKHRRNLSNNQIKKIVDTNGFLGITIYDEFISKEKITSEDIAKQFDYLVKKFGANNLGLGTDLYGISSNHLPTDLDNYGKIENLIFELKKLSYKDTVIEKLIFKNFENFLQKSKL